MGGITGLGSSYKEQALGGLRSVAGMEQQRENANEILSKQADATKMSTALTGAGMGIGAAQMGLAGTAATAAVEGGAAATAGTGLAGAVGMGAATGGLALAGLAAGYLFSELF